MQNLQLNNITFKYSQVNIFSNINLNFNQGWTSVIGNNGVGKTTLLKLIAKLLKPESGTIIGNDVVYYCAQKLEKEPNGFEEFNSTYNNNTFKLKELLNIEEEWLYRWETLSFGEKKRIQIAIALFMEPDILLLDEPTNHLDLKTKSIVIKTLEIFKGVGILVSHDREVLNFLCANTLILKNKKLYLYKTNYNDAIKQFNDELNFLQKENENINKKIKKLQKNIQLQKEKVSKSKQRLSKKVISKKDKSLKNKINLAKLTGKDKNDSKLVSSLSKKLEETSSKKHLIGKHFDKGIKIKDEKIIKSKFKIFLEEGSLKLTEKKSLYFPNLWINENDRIYIKGKNGVGKSSFLRYIISKIKSKKDYLYLSQEIKDRQLRDLLDQIEKLSNEKKAEVFCAVQRLSSDPKKIFNIKLASPGEIRKLFIANAILNKINFLILDEPTNHMDIDSIESLEKALQDYNKTLIIVSHDKEFIRNIKLKIWDIQEISQQKNLLKDNSENTKI